MTLQPQRRYEDLDAARFLAAFFVVFHHVVVYFHRSQIPQIFSFSIAVDIMRYIHIPVFITLSGILIGHQQKDIQSVSEYVRFEKKKFYRLMLPYFSVSIVNLILQAVVRKLSVSEIISLLIGTAVAPHAGPMFHGWYLFMLMCIMLVWPFLVPFCRGKYAWFLFGGLLTLAILPIPWPEYVSIHNNKIPYFEFQRFRWYIPMFMVGYLYGKHLYGTWRCPALLRYLAFFVVGGAMYAEVFFQPIAQSSLAQAAFLLIRWIGYLAAGYTFLWFWSSLNNGLGEKIRHGFSAFGVSSYDIYLFHVIIANLLVLGIPKLHPTATFSFVLLFICSLVTMYICYGIGQLIRRFSWASFILLGEPRRKIKNT